MLHDFISTHQAAILVRTRQLLVDRAVPAALPDALDNGVPLFLALVSDTLRRETTTTPFTANGIADSATLHGSDLLALGFTVSQVVHAYGDICQVVTALAIEENAPILPDEFRILNRCLDDAIADAVTEHARQTEEYRFTEEAERLGRLTHEIRNLLNTALLAYQMLKRGDVAINGSTGAVLGRSLTGLTHLVETTLSDVRMAASRERKERIPLAVFLSDIATAGLLDAECRGLRFSCELPPVGLHVTADPQLLASAISNLLNNAFKYTLPGTTVVMRARQEGSSAMIEVEDRCGGIPEGKGDPFAPFGDRRGGDRTGLGLGLSIARRAIRSSGGDINLCNVPGRGCTFAIELPTA